MSEKVLNQVKQIMNLTRDHPYKIKYESKEIRIQVSKKAVQEVWQTAYETLKNPKKMWTVAEGAKKLMNEGLMNLDVISNETLVRLLFHQQSTVFPKGLLEGNTGEVGDFLKGITEEKDPNSN